MTLVASLTIGVLFGAGSYMLLKRDLIRVVAGVILISNSVNLFIVFSGLSRGAAPILPFRGGVASDPLVQALTLTAIVITFGVSALLLALVYRTYTSHLSLDLDDLSAAEEREADAENAADLSREAIADRDAVVAVR